jgi:alpha-mannosidase
MARVWSERDWNADWRLLDERAEEVPFQRIGAHIGHRCILLQTKIARDGLRVYRLDLSQARAMIKPRVEASGEAIWNERGLEVRATAWGQEIRRDGRVVPVGFHLIADGTDTWSHGISRYAEGPSPAMFWEQPEILERGPLRAAFVQRGDIGGNRLHAEWRVYADEDAAELILDVDWRACQQILKLVLPLAGEQARLDGTPGMGLERPNNAYERPLHDWTRANSLAVVCPEAWAIDATPERLRLTLLRAPYYALHDPIPGVYPRAILMDQGRQSVPVPLPPRSAGG